jgi:hypothetical protein
MTRTVYLTFDGQVFRPEGPIDLEPDTRVRATIEPAGAKAGALGAFLAIAKSLKLDGPPDWSSHLEDYLYRVPFDGE